MSDSDVFAQIVSRSTIQDGVYRQLRHALMTGRFEPGQMLTMASLSESFGTSHMPVREALRRLVAENALELAANGSARIPATSRTKLDDLSRARVALERLATELAVPNVTARDIAHLEDNVRENETIGRTESVYAMLDKNQAFHFYLYRISRSDVLIQLIETLWLRFGPYMRMLTHHIGPLLKSESASTSTIYQREIIGALKAGNVAAASAAIAADIEATRDLLRVLIQEEQA